MSKDMGFGPRLLVVFGFAAAFGSCKTNDGSTTSASAEGLTTVWLDESLDAKGRLTPCTTIGSTDTQLCAFHDLERRLVWSAPLAHRGKPLLLTWQAAKAKCASLKVPAKAEEKWRLPTRPEYEAAVRDESGALRAASMIAFGETSPEFGRVLQFQSLWTTTPEYADGKRYWAAQRIDHHFIFALSSVSDKLPLRCVRTTNGLAAEPTPPTPPAPAPVPVVETAAKAETKPKTPPQAPPKAARTVTAAAPEYSLASLSASPTAMAPSETRERITGYLKRAFAAAGLDSQLLGKSGELIIASTSGFFFSDASSQVLNEQVPALRKVLQEYVDVLIAARTLEGLKIRLQVVGYASPSFQGEPQIGFDPQDPEDRGGLHNRITGMRRAEQVKDLLAGMDSARSLTLEVYTKGSEEAVVDANGPNAKCGDFNCIASRRVIIRFHLDGNR